MIPMKQAPVRTATSGAVIVIIACGSLLAVAGPAHAQGARHNHHLQVRDQIENELLSSPEMQQAQRDVAEARAAYDRARHRALLSLEKVARYRKLRAEADAVQERLDDVYFTYRYGIAPQDVTIRLATQIHRLRREMARHEVKALAGDLAVQQAKQALTDAGQRLTELRRDIPHKIRSDPRFQRARGRR